MPVHEHVTDAELVAATLAGDRRAFGLIVERYQRLLCSLAYSATGELSRSEDLAQEAFVDAWRQLAELREPEKLRAWLCGILRHKVSRMRRSDGREPVSRADSLEAAEELEADDQPVADHAMQREEEALMWSALERVPETYREPLILYYREHRSIEHVAAALDLTEDAVKQRLSRGRKVLQEQVLAFVEGALARSTPGRLFTIATLASLPNLAAPSAQAAVVGTGAGLVAKGGSLAKGTLLATLIASWSGVINTVLVLRASLDQSRTPRERRAVVKVTIGMFFGALAYLGVLWLLREGAWRWWEQRLAFAAVTQVLVIGFIVAWPVGVLGMMRSMRRLRTAERLAHPELFRAERDQVGSAAGEYRSRLTLAGVPLVHLRFSWAEAGQPPVFGWVAGGDRAYGLLCAWGGYAVAPLSVGSIAVGLIAIGNLSVGLFSFGTVALGWLAIGCAAVGYQAFAWLSALGWHTAQSGGFGLAWDAVRAPVGFAASVNEAAASAALAGSGNGQHDLLFISIVTVLSMVPLFFYVRAVRRRMR